MIAAPGSGSGKTMVTCGLLTLLKRKAYNPAAYKCGPDYIDGLFHRRVLGVDSGNLDSFFETAERMNEKISHSMKNHYVVAEGVMGYFDGLGGISSEGSSYEIARILNLPVILVVDAKGASLSLCALIKGFLEYDAEKVEREEKTHERKTHNHIAGIFFNRMSPMMYKLMKKQTEEQLGVPVIGYLPELEFLKVGSRHLGLVLPGEIDGLKGQMEQLADRMDDCLEWDLFHRIAAEGNRGLDTGSVPDHESGTNTVIGSGMTPVINPSADAAPGITGPALTGKTGDGFRLGVAMDEAFCFYYSDNLKAMEDAGAELIPFSPIHHRELPGGLDGMILGGGYPENHGAALAGNTGMLQSVAAAAAAGMPVLAECGGYLYLLDSLECTDGNVYPMAGVLGGHGFRAGKTGRFGYITLEAGEGLPYLEKGGTVKGHEFHYWDCRVETDEFCMKAVKPRGSRSWPCMRKAERVMAGFPHLYYPSCPELVQRFADQCMIYGKER